MAESMGVYTITTAAGETIDVVNTLQFAASFAGYCAEKAGMPVTVKAQDGTELATITPHYNGG